MIFNQNVAPSPQYSDRFAALPFEAFLNILLQVFIFCVLGACNFHTQHMGSTRNSAQHNLRRQMGEKPLLHKSDRSPIHSLIDWPNSPNHATFKTDKWVGGDVVPNTINPETATGSSPSPSPSVRHILNKIYKKTPRKLAPTFTQHCNLTSQ